MRPQHFGGLAAPREFACPMRDVDQGHLRSSAMLVGWLYDISIGTLVVVVIALELMALVMMFAIRLPRVAPS